MPSQATISRRVRAAACAAALLSAALRAQEPAPVQRTTETLAWQAALEARGFSPGLVDGIAGPKTLLAGAAFQAAEGLPVTGRLDEATGEALGVADLPPVAAYTLTREDAAQVSPCPPDWIERSRRARLLYRSLADLVAEKLHTSERCLAWLNPGTDLAALRPGDAIAVPAPRPRAAPRAAAVVEIDLERKLVLLLDAGERLCGLLHCSVAADLGDVAR
ncbi:MAG: peptidoglycan-binding protein, partial [Planctomycetes bacterium]|nr:peptidoglycan-binding protein [Planctomycetota bacterium]